MEQNTCENKCEEACKTHKHTLVNKCGCFKHLKIFDININVVNV